MKIAIAQINSYQADIKKNTRKIIEYILKAKKMGVDLLIFPELAITGYFSMDLFLNSEFINKNKSTLEKIIKVTSNIAVIIGFVDYKIENNSKRILYNSAAIIQNKKLIGTQNKTLLPEYDIFNECRYFTSSKESKIFNICGINIGIQICEDMWDKNYKKKITNNLKNLGAKIIVNLSASPFYQGKFKERLNEIKRHNLPFIYVNSVGVQDGYDGQIIFDGNSIITNSNGKIISLGKSFEEDLIISDLEKTNSEVEFKENEIKNLYDSLVFAVKQYFKLFKDKKAIIGLSGGIDSALVAVIAKDALGCNRVKAIAMPSRYSSNHSLRDAKKLAKNLKIEYIVAPIEKIHKEFGSIFKDITNKKITGVTDENIQARIRGNINMMFSNFYDDFVLSTGNKTEIALGYCTLYGDMAGGLSPIADVDKLEVYKLAKYINKKENKEIIPKNIIEKSPSAELAPNQNDEIGLGASYEILTPLVNEIIENQKTRKELIQIYNKNLVDNCLNRIYSNEFKRRQASPGIKVTKKSFGIGRRIPLNYNYL